MIILNKNLIDNTTTMTCSGTFTKYPLSNLIDYQLFNYCKIPAYDNYIIFNLNSAKSINCLGIAFHNLTNASLIISNDPTFTTNINEIILDCTQTTILEQFPTVSAQYFKLIINDGYIKQIGYISIGSFVSMPGMDSTQEMTTVINDSSEMSMSFQSFGSIGYTQNILKVNYPRVTLSQKKSIIDIFKTNRSWLPFFVKLWNKSTDYPVLYAVLGDNTVNVKRSGSLLKPYTLDLTFKETL